MRKVYVLPPNEDWIVDRFVHEWNIDNSDISINNYDDADVIWLLADWCWQRIPLNKLLNKKVIATVHHIVPEKFKGQQFTEFVFRDGAITTYHVPNQHTHDFIRPLTKKPIHIIPYWANQHIWRSTGERNTLRAKYQLPIDGYLVGSFQRDTEGVGIARGIYEPKKEKGPDLLADYLIWLALDSDAIANKKLHIVLAGWRRQYVMQRLKLANVAFSYFELPSQEVINDLYQTLDLYPVSARYEGGPQSLIECGLHGIPVVSRNVGMASQVLPASAIHDNLFEAIPAVPNVQHLVLPSGYAPYRKLIEEV